MSKTEDVRRVKEVQFDDADNPRFLSTLKLVDAPGTIKKPLTLRKGHFDKLEIIKQRTSLPVFQGREAFLDEFRHNTSLVLIGETGCGKTTQIPQYIYESKAEFYSANTAFNKPRPRIAVTQPRRVAAISLARRVNDEISATLNATFSEAEEISVVGHRVRFED